MKDSRSKPIFRNRQTSQSSKVWINPNSSFKGPRAYPNWERHGMASPSAARLLELADVALRDDQPSAPLVKKNKAAA